MYAISLYEYKHAVVARAVIVPTLQSVVSRLDSTFNLTSSGVESAACHNHVKKYTQPVKVCPFVSNFYTNVDDGDRNDSFQHVFKGT